MLLLLLPTRFRITYKNETFIPLYRRIKIKLVEFGLVCSQTQLCHIGVFNDYIEQLHVSAFSGHLRVFLREQT